MEATERKVLLTDPKDLPKSTTCPNPTCRAGADKRIASAGFGTPHPICGRCGHAFVGERWDG